MKLARDQYFSGDMGNFTFVMWITYVKPEGSSTKSEVGYTLWKSIHEITEGKTTTIEGMESYLWKGDSVLIDKEKATMLIDLWKPYE